MMNEMRDRIARRAPLGRRLAAVCVISLLVAACAGTDADDRPLTRDDAGADAGADLGTLDAAGANNDADMAGTDAATETDADTDAGNSGFCSPNFDGRIARDEVTLRPGLSAKFKVAQDAPVDMEGVVEGDERSWTLAEDLPGDALELIELRDPDQFWFSGSFPNATYVTRLSAREELLGVFQATDDALLLLGVVSPDEGVFGTELEYDPPVEILSFPLEADKTWTGVHDVTGTAQGVFVAYEEEYFSEVWAAGTLATPFGSFDVQSVRVELTRTIGFSETTIRTYAFVSECFGTVATVNSQDNEDQIFFTEAAEVRRLTP